MSKTNERVRTELKKNGMYQWQLAKLLGVSEPTFTRKMREELSEEEQDRLVSIIKGGISNDN